MKLKVLVVDDEESIRFTFENFLSEEGYSVSTAGNFKEAVSKIEGESFDIIFADIILGDKTGIDILQKIKERRLSCPVIIMTGYPNIETVSEALRLGAFDYITKPVSQQTLLHAARLALKHKALVDEKEKYLANLDAVFRSVKDAIITVDEELAVTTVNEAAKNICGITPDDIGKKFISANKGCSVRCLGILEETIKNRTQSELNRVECRRNDEVQVLSLTASPLQNRHGKFLGAVLVVRDETRLSYLERNLGEREQFQNIIGKNEKIQGIYSLIEDLADVLTTVLITGESGTGKELVAEALHFRGERRNNPLVKVNCSALSESLLESELFGHTKGAFTGAFQDKTGRFQRAEGGTILLDEIGDISQAIQLKLLRVIQEKEFERVGESKPIKADVRVIASTHQDLAEKVKRGEFREDLYYRLKVIEIKLPPLRERREDIPLLTTHFLKQFNKKFSKDISAVSEDVMKLLMSYNWPGNVREMEHVLEHAFILCRQNTITVEHLPQEIKSSKETGVSLSANNEDSDRQAIINALERSAWNKAKAARLLGIDRKTIYRKIEKHKIKES